MNHEPRPMSRDLRAVLLALGVLLGVAGFALSLIERLNPEPHGAPVSTGPDGGQMMGASLPVTIPAPPATAGNVLETTGDAEVPIAWQVTSTTNTLARLMPIEAGVVQFYWALDQDAASIYQSNTGLTGGDGSTYSLEGITTACAPDRTGLFFGGVGCYTIGNCGSSTVGSGAITNNVPLDAGALNSTAATWDMWIYPLTLATNNNNYFMRSYRPSTASWAAPYESMSIVQTTNAGCWACNVAAAGSLYTAGTGNCFGYGSSAGYITTAQWQHLACTFDGNTLKAYTNGLIIASTSVSAGAAVPIDFGDGGTNQTGGYFQLMYTSQSNNQCSTGIVDDIRVETVVRDQAYLRQLYQMGVSGSQN